MRSWENVASANLCGPPRLGFLPPKHRSQSLQRNSGVAQQAPCWPTPALTYNMYVHDFLDITWLWVQKQGPGRKDFHISSHTFTMMEWWVKVNKQIRNHKDNKYIPEQMKILLYHPQRQQCTRQQFSVKIPHGESSAFPSTSSHSFNLGSKGNFFPGK